MFHVKHSPFGGAEGLSLEAGFEVSRETLDRLSILVDLLLLWNQRIRLMSQADEATIWTRHVADSLQLAPLMGLVSTHAIDLGSGAGFPGLVLSLATGVRFCLVEVDQRKAAFLREAARLTGTNVEILVARAESLRVGAVPLVTARACAPLEKLLAYAAPLLTSTGKCLFPRGVQVESELTVALRAWNMAVERFPSRTAPDATILRLSGIHRVGAGA
jgi:16S rRNA (guanine527-N7)-methyltransferase